MHEMPITQSFLNIALEHCQGRRITDIYLQVGMMSAIVPETVDVFFEHLSKYTLAEGAKLHFTLQPIEMVCQDCGAQVDLSEWMEKPPHLIMVEAFNRGCVCGSKKLRVSDGVSFDVINIEVE